MLATLLADLHRAVKYLDLDIETELDRARSRDRSQPEYPLIATAMVARRSNLADTIASLESRLATQLPALAPA